MKSRLRLVERAVFAIATVWVGLSGVTGATPASAAATPSSAMSFVSPSAVHQNQLVDITISGSGFRSNLRPVVAQGDIDTLSYSTLDSSTITARLQVSPGADVGAKDVWLIDTTNNTYAGNGCIGCLTVTGISISGVSPDRIQRGTSKIVTVSGSGIVDGTTVAADGANLLGYTVHAPNSVDVNLAVGDRVPGSIGLTLTTPEGGQKGIGLIADGTIQVDDVSPNVVGDPATTDIVIRGSGFAGPGPNGNISVSFNYPGNTTTPWSTSETPPSVMSVSRDTFSQITVRIHTNGSTHLGAYDVFVSTNDGNYGGCTSCLTVQRVGYAMLTAGGDVHSFGDAPAEPALSLPAGVTAVHIEQSRRTDGYWVLDSAGVVHALGGNQSMGATPIYGQVNRGSLTSGETLTTISSTPSGNGYWVFSSKGRVFAFGDAHNFGDMAGRPLNGPVIGSIPTPSGNGYYMVATDGGIFTFGDATFHGSMGGARLNKPVNGLVPTVDGSGYWLVASDGGVFSFNAPFRGSTGDRHLNRPVVGLVRFGNGYLMVAADGGVFNFSDKPFLGSLGANPPPTPVVSIVTI